MFLSIHVRCSKHRGKTGKGEKSMSRIAQKHKGQNYWTVKAQQLLNLNILSKALFNLTLNSFKCTFPLTSISISFSTLFIIFLVTSVSFSNSSDLIISENKRKRRGIVRTRHSTWALPVMSQSTRIASSGLRQFHIPVT